jgi:hypothetical protein
MEGKQYFQVPLDLTKIQPIDYSPTDVMVRPDEEETPLHINKQAFQSSDDEYDDQFASDNNKSQSPAQIDDVKRQDVSFPVGCKSNTFSGAIVLPFYGDITNIERIPYLDKQTYLQGKVKDLANGRRNLMLEDFLSMHIKTVLEMLQVPNAPLSPVISTIILAFTIVSEAGGKTDFRPALPSSNDLTKCFKNCKLELLPRHRQNEYL